MSASLVGSEMCIRDSSPRGRWRPAWRKDLGPVGHPPSRTARAPGCPISTCLLYTSDAADDM
eukprot:8906272-Alexandrium_andersonii.AAC.1